MSSLKRSNVHDDLNRIMIGLVPELDCEWTLSPMSYDRWRQPTEHIDNGDPCFIATEEDQGIRKDYIFCADRKNIPPGYYHMRTQAAFAEVYGRLLKKRPGFGTRFGGETVKRKRKDYFKIKKLLFNRMVSDEPDDVHAARMAVLDASAAGAKASQFGHAMYLPVLTSVLLIGS
jgi:hypothetical protein